MATQNVHIWFKTVIAFEGGKVDDPHDPGGRTNRGVTERVYNGYRRARGLPIRDVFEIENREVADIYKTGYWDKCWGDRLPSGVDVVVCDGAINSGVSQSVKWLQRALGVRVDGIMGDATLTAALAADADALVTKIIQLREAFLRALKTFKRYGKGWLRRTSQLKKLGLELTAGQGAVSNYKLTLVPGMGRKASLEDAKKALPKLDAIWGAGTSTGALAQVTATLEPFQNIQKIATLLSIITVVGVLLGIAGGIWAWYARKKTDELNDALDTRPSLPSSTPGNDNDVSLENTIDIDASLPEDLGDVLKRA